MKKIVGLGACVIDTLITCENYPLEDMKCRAKNIIRTGGGPVSNALITAVKYGCKAEFIGCLSSDNDGVFLKNELMRYGVDCSKVHFEDNTKSFKSYILLSEKGGSRTCVFDRGNVPDTPRLIDYSSIDECDILHLDGNNLYCAVYGASYAKNKNKKVSLDIGNVYEGIERLLPYIDILITSENFARQFTKEQKTCKAIEILKEKYNPEVLVVTQGDKGGLFYENGTLKSYESFKVKCVDSNGAGDAFHGAFLATYLNGNSIEYCCNFASAVSAIKCTKTGMRDSLPTKDEVYEFMLKNKNNN